MAMSTEVIPSMSPSVRGKFLRAKSKNRWNRRQFSKRNEGTWNRGVLLQNGVYEPPRSLDLQEKNRLKTQRFYRRKSHAPRAPRNTTSFIMRAKNSGGLPALVSPITPTVLPTPVFSPALRFREGLVDEVNKEWGVDGYGSMNGLIRLRTFGGESDVLAFPNDSDSEVEQDPHSQSVQKLEQRIDNGLSRFEIVGCQPLLDVKVEELESRIAKLEDENLSLRENLYLIQQELADANRRLLFQNGVDCVSDDNADVASESSGGGVLCAQV